MKMILAAAALLLPALAGAEKFSIRDEGDFAPVGHRVEFADRYGWRGYQVDFDFELDASGRDLTKESKLTVRIARRDGSTWKYSCKRKSRDSIYANVNYLMGTGISIVAECRIPQKEFAKAVNLHPDDVGLPNLVFQAVVQDGQVRAGAQRGLYFMPGGQIESSELNAYAARNDDPTNLAVVFRSN